MSDEKKAVKKAEENTKKEVELNDLEKVSGGIETGKSTFIKHLMDLLVIPNIDNDTQRHRE